VQALEFSNTFSVVSNRRAESQGLPPQQPYVEFAPAVSSWQVASLKLGEPRPGAFGGDDWAYFRVFVSAFSAVLSVKAWTRAPGLEVTLAIRRGLRPTHATFLARADSPGPDGAYTVSVAAPVTGAFYYVGVRRFPSCPPECGGSAPGRRAADNPQGAVQVFARMRAVDTSEFLLLADSVDGVAVRPPVKQLQSYFVRFDALPVRPAAPLTTLCVCDGFP